MKNNKKGQAAMEYLMTYGWALLVIVIVLALLLIILGGYLRGTPSCIFEEAGFSCSDSTPIISASNGALYGEFKHIKDSTIEISAIACVQGQVNKEDVTWTPRLSGPIEISPRSSKNFGEIAGTLADDGGVRCFNANGDRLTGLTPGSQIRGQLWIKYREKNDDNIGFLGNRTAVATVIANVE